MPHRLFNVDEVAAYLHLNRAEVQRLVKQHAIPFVQQGDRVVFQRRNVDAWASQRILGMPRRSLAEYHKASSRAGGLSQQGAFLSALIAPERIAPALSSRTKASTLRQVVAFADGTGLVCDSADLLRSIEERESLCSTAVEGGIALLHPRHHEPYVFLDSFVVLARTMQPIHAGAQDGEPTDLFFLICCQDDRMHLNCLARICAMFHSTSLPRALREAPDAGSMFAEIAAAETELISRL